MLCIFNIFILQTAVLCKLFAPLQIAALHPERQSSQLTQYKKKRVLEKIRIKKLRNLMWKQQCFVTNKYLFK